MQEGSAGSVAQRSGPTGWWKTVPQKMGKFREGLARHGSQLVWIVCSQFKEIAALAGCHIL